MNEILSNEIAGQFNDAEQSIEQQVRELSPAEVMAVAGGPLITNQS